MQDRVRVLFLLVSDFVCVSFAWVAAVLVVGFCKDSESALQTLPYWFNVWPMVFVFAVINWFSRLYHGRGTYPAMPLPEVEEFKRLVLSATAAHVLLLAYLSFNKISGATMSNWILILAFALTAVGAQPMRYAVRHLLARLGWGQIPCLVVGEGSSVARLRSALESSSYYGFRIVRQFGQHDLAALLEFAREQNVRHLFACYSDDRFFKASFPELAQQFTFIEFIPTAESFPTSGAQIVQVGGLGGLEMTNQRQLKLLTLTKSVVDRSLAMVIFLFAVPFFLIIPVLIKLTSRGPVFYKAKRLGKKGRPISVWKFRSMYADADRRLQAMLAADPALKAELEKDFKLKNDPRVTPLGRFMRKTSIDELPQLFNVFLRDMALIGPRPIVEKEVEKYGKAYEIFASVKPGITGLWQASGRSDCSYDERVALDVHYILNWSPWMDLWIVFRTAAAVLKMKGSY